MQELAAGITFALVALLGAAFLFVVRRSGVRTEDPARAAARARTWLFVGLLVAFVPITALSLAHTPYGADERGAVVVEAVGHQWYWKLNRTTVPVGRTVVFRVTSADVNHGFAVYDADLRLLGQTQAMPGYWNGLALRFDAPGVYRILCLEYCGAVHHGMAATVEAVAEDDR